MYKIKLNGVCKECAKEIRIDGSSRCQKCTATHKNYLLGQERFHRKVEMQAKD